MNVDAEFRSLPAHLFGGIPTQVANKRTVGGVVICRACANSGCRSEFVHPFHKTTSPPEEQCSRPKLGNPRRIEDCRLVFTLPERASARNMWTMAQIWSK